MRHFLFLFIPVFAIVVIGPACTEDSVASLNSISIKSMYTQASGIFYVLKSNSIENPDNVLGIQKNEVYPVGVISGNLFGVNFEMEAVGDYLNPDTSNPFSVNLNELYVVVPVGNSVFFTVGKKRINWDSTPVMRPLDFFDTNRESLDFNDETSPDDGRIGFVANYVNSLFSMTFAFCDDRWTEEDPYNLRGGINSALKVNFMVNPINVVVAGNVIRTEEGKISPAFGLSVDTIIRDNIKIYSSGLIRRGSLQMLSKAAIYDAQVVYTDSPIGQWRIDDGRWYPQVTAGVQWNPDSENTLYLAGLYDLNKYNESEWNRLLSAIDYHSDSSLLNIYPETLIDANRAWDGAVSKYIFARRLHAAARWSLTMDKFETALNYVLSLEDYSGFGEVSAKYYFSDVMSIRGEFAFFTGKEGTEFGSYPIGLMFGLQFVYLLK